MQDSGVGIVTGLGMRFLRDRQILVDTFRSLLGRVLRGCGVPERIRAGTVGKRFRRRHSDDHKVPGSD